MRKLLCLLLLMGSVLFISLPGTEAAPKTATTAVVFLGSMEFQRPEYYKLVTESWKTKFPESGRKLVVGEPIQRMFERFSDAQGFLPGEIPAEDKLMQFASSNSFDDVAFLIMTVPTITSSDIALQKELARVTLGVQVLVFDSHGKKTTDVQTRQTVERWGRDNARKAAFEKCLDFLREKVSSGPNLFL